MFGRVSWLVGWLAGRLAGWLAGWLLNSPGFFKLKQPFVAQKGFWRAVLWLAGWPAGPVTGRLAGRLSGRKDEWREGLKSPTVGAF